MRRWVAVAACASLLAPALAAAEPSKADKLFEEGKHLSDKGDWAGACAKFEASIQLDAEAPGTMLNLGRCNENLGKIGTALHWYQKADEHAQKYNMPEYQTAARERTADLAARAPSLRFELAEALPAGGRILVDGVEIAPQDRARLVVDPGHHAIDVQAPHKAPIHREVDAKERDDLPIRVDAFSAAQVVDPGEASRRHAWVFGGVGAGLLAGQLVVGLVGKSHYKADMAAHPGWNNFANYGLTSIGVIGAAGVAYGVYLYLSAPKPYEADRTAWVPLAGPDQLGVAYTGRF